MPRGTPAKLDSFLRNLPPACFPHSHFGKGAEGRPSSTVFVFHGCGSLRHSPSSPPRHLGLSSSSLCSAPLHLVSPTTSLFEISVVFQPLFWLSPCLDPFPYQILGEKGVCHAAFYLWSPWGGCAVVGLHWHQLSPKSQDVMSVIQYPCLPALPSPIVSRWESPYPPLSPFCLLSCLRSLLWALCVAAVSLSPPLCSLSSLFQLGKTGTSRASVFQVCGVQWRWGWCGLPVCPAMTPTIPLSLE